jgi:hypothetical protein
MHSQLLSLFGRQHHTSVFDHSRAALPASSHATPIPTAYIRRLEHSPRPLASSRHRCRRRTLTSGLAVQPTEGKVGYEAQPLVGALR